MKMHVDDHGSPTSNIKPTPQNYITSELTNILKIHTKIQESSNVISLAWERQELDCAFQLDTPSSRIHFGDQQVEVQPI